MYVLFHKDPAAMDHWNRMSYNDAVHVGFSLSSPSLSLSVSLPLLSALSFFLFSATVF